MQKTLRLKDQRENGLVTMIIMRFLISWAHLASKTLYELQLEERQLIIWIYHLGLEHIGVETFDPTEKGLGSDYTPQEGRADHSEKYYDI